MPTTAPHSAPHSSLPLNGQPLWLPISHQVANHAKQAGLAMEAVLEAFISLPHPYHVAFEISAGGGEPTVAGFSLSGIDDESTHTAAATFGHIFDALNGWTGLGSPTLPPARPEASHRYSLRPGHGKPRKIYSHCSGAWTVAANLATRTTMRVDVLDSAHDEAVEARCHIVIEGTGDDAALVSSLVASDLLGRMRLEPELLHQLVAPEITIDLAVAGHLTATPARLANVWPTATAVPMESVYDRIESATPPHGVVLGGTGQGKTTLIEHLIDRSFERGNTAVVFCPHGDLAARAAALAEAHDADADVYDFSHANPPLLNVCATPPGFTPNEWSGEVVHLIRNMWPHASDEWFGPVFRRSLRSALRVLIEDPRGPHRIGQITSVLREPNSWLDAAERIGDPDVKRSMVETAKSIANDKESSLGPWLFSKLEPVLGNAAMSRIIDQPRTSVQLDGVNRGRSMIVAVPTAQLGDEGSTLLTSIVLTQVWRALRLHPDANRRVDVFIDEAHRMPARLLSEILAEARKYGVQLRLATQSPLQLDESLRDAVLANSGSVATFRTSPKAATLLDGLYPTVLPTSMTQLKQHQVAVSFGPDDVIALTEPPIVTAEQSEEALERGHLGALEAFKDRTSPRRRIVRSSSAPAR